MSISKYEENKDSDFNAVVRKGSMYKVKGKETPDSALAQQLANVKGVKGQIINFDITETKCFVHVRAIATNGQYVEDIMVYEWETLKEICLLDMIDKAIKDNKLHELIESYDKQGKPILFQEKKWELYKRFIRLKHFAIRDLATKSYRRAYLKLLNKEWVETDEEKDLEELEQRTVENSKTIPRILENNDSKADFTDEEIEEMMYQGEKDTLDSIEDTNTYTLRKYLEDNSKNLLFPKKSIKQFNEVCKLIADGNKDFLRFYILDTKYKGLQLKNWEYPDNKLDYWQLYLVFPDNSEKPISMIFHKVFGDLRASKSTKSNYGDDKDLNFFLKRIAFGENVFIAPQSLYKGFEALQKKITNNK